MDPTTFDAGPLAAVSSEEHADGTWTVTFVREFAPPPERVWAALVREMPDPEAAEPAALLAACALLRGDGALAGIALYRAEQAWPGHRLTGLLRAVWAAGMPPERVRECFCPPPAAAMPVRRVAGRSTRRSRR